MRTEAERSMSLKSALARPSFVGSRSGEAEDFASARDLAAWLGLVPKQTTAGGKPRLGGITPRSLDWELIESVQSPSVDAEGIWPCDRAGGLPCGSHRRDT